MAGVPGGLSLSIRFRSSLSFEILLKSMKFLMLPFLKKCSFKGLCLFAQLYLHSKFKWMIASGKQRFISSIQRYTYVSDGFRIFNLGLLGRREGVGSSTHCFSYERLNNFCCRNPISANYLSILFSVESQLKHDIFPQMNLVEIELD